MFEYNDNLKKNIVAYNGPLTINLISLMANHLKEIIPFEQGLRKKVFRVFIELTQNVSYYSALVSESPKAEQPKRGIGWYTLDDYDEYLLFKTGNLIFKEHGPILIKNTDEINKLSDEDLRMLKRKTRSQAAVRDIGAHIGLIQTGIISGNPIEVNISEVDDKHSFFEIAVKINKTNSTI
ncbi:MAG: SiaB family protein kinase [Bacteroidales bacterium]|nr:SiaB family protein kinase [Bacteroidales bacterium]MBN2817838.1 SiaB family protein kinase [Bacteroidales bacterium]